MKEYLMTFAKIKISLYQFLDSLIGEPFDMSLEPYGDYNDVTIVSKTDECVSAAHVVYDATHMTVV